jgi:multidrug resistance efflux pump
MRGRWASAALGAGLARRQMSHEMDQQAQYFDAQQADAQRQIEAQQRQIENLQRQKQSAQPQQEDSYQKLKKYADLKQQGIITEEELQKLKLSLLSKI